MKQWLENLSDAERKQLMGVGALVFVVLFYFVLWAPLANSVDSKQQAIEKQAALNEWSKNAIAQIKSSSKPQRDYGSLSQIINGSTRQFNISVSRMNPTNDTMNVVIDEVVFTTLMQWLAHLEQRQGVKIHNVDVSLADDAGVVRVSRLVLGKAKKKIRVNVMKSWKASLGIFVVAYLAS